MSEERIKVTKEQAAIIAENQYENTVRNHNNCLGMGINRNLAPRNVWVKNRMKELLEKGAHKDEYDIVK